MNTLTELSPDQCRIRFTHMLASGKIVKQACSICGNPKSEGHHPDNQHPEQVVWYCRKHHCSEHRRIRLVTNYAYKRPDCHYTPII